MIAITESAAAKLKELMQSADTETYVRYEVKRECCSQMNYSLSLAGFKLNHEEVEEIDGIRVLLDPNDSRYINGTEIDYQGDGFWIKNPNPLVAPLR